MKITKEFKIELKKVYRLYYNRMWSKNNKEKKGKNMKVYNKQYYIDNKDKIKLQINKYRSTQNGKKTHRISSWKLFGLIETKEEIDRIYEIYTTQIYCNACNCILTRTGKNCKTQAQIVL